MIFYNVLNIEPSVDYCLFLNQKHNPLFIIKFDSNWQLVAASNHIKKTTIT